MREVLVVPDVHGLDFWKPAMEYDGEVVFLGDYLDPYEVSIADALENFAEIMEFVIEKRDDVCLLLGNHDYAYMHVKDVTRKCYGLEKTINYLYNHFGGVYGLPVVTKRGNVLFSHAGVSDEWLNYNNLNLDDDNHSQINCLENEVWSCSSVRGGTDKYSGPLWLDLYEVLRDEVHLSGYQVFGHTRLKNKGLPIKWDNVACVDNETLYTIDVEANNPIETLQKWR